MKTNETLVVEGTEVTAKATRRRFAAEYKKRILKEADECTRTGEVGALLRREGLYSSHLTVWRKAQREHGVERGLEPRRRGPQARPVDARDLRITGLERELAGIRAELGRSKAVIEIQKKVSELFGLIPAPTSEPK
jgi:transposase-like protein